MPPTVHKLLIHCPAVLAKSLLPIGQLSEETRNKEINKFREDFSRKCAIDKTNKDIFLPTSGVI